MQAAYDWYHSGVLHQEVQRYNLGWIRCWYHNKTYVPVNRMCLNLKKTAKNIHRKTVIYWGIVFKLLSTIHAILSLDPSPAVSKVLYVRDHCNSQPQSRTVSNSSMASGTFGKPSSALFSGAQQWIKHFILESVPWCYRASIGLQSAVEVVKVATSTS